MDALTEFLHSSLNSRIGLATLAPRSQTTVMAHSSVSTFVLYRHQQFQLELVLIHPGSPEWPGVHRHPNVDSYEVALFLPIQFKKNGELVPGPELQVPVDLGVGTILADCVRLRPTDWHGALAQPQGAALLSVQQWLNGVEPTSVGLDWEGQPTTEGHAQQLANHG